MTPKNTQRTSIRAILSEAKRNFHHKQNNSTTNDIKRHCLYKLHIYVNIIYLYRSFVLRLKNKAKSPKGGWSYHCCRMLRWSHWWRISPPRLGRHVLSSANKDPTEPPHSLVMLGGVLLPQRIHQPRCALKRLATPLKYIKWPMAAFGLEENTHLSNRNISISEFMFIWFQNKAHLTGVSSGSKIVFFLFFLNIYI